VPRGDAAKLEDAGLDDLSTGRGYCRRRGVVSGRAIVIALIAVVAIVGGLGAEVVRPWQILA